MFHRIRNQNKQLIKGRDTRLVIVGQKDGRPCEPGNVPIGVARILSYFIIGFYFIFFSSKS